MFIVASKCDSIDLEHGQTVFGACQVPALIASR